MTLRQYILVHLKNMNIIEVLLYSIYFKAFISFIVDDYGSKPTTTKKICLRKVQYYISQIGTSGSVGSEPSPAGK